jgi:hypothetical protein
MLIEFDRYFFLCAGLIVTAILLTIALYRAASRRIPHLWRWAWGVSAAISFLFLVILWADTFAGYLRSGS